jgi:alpha-glucosidase
MKTLHYASKVIHKIKINSYEPVIDFNFDGKQVKEPKSDKIKIDGQEIRIKETADGLEISKALDINEHILGLGEKAFELDRRRTKLTMWNTDAYAYRQYTDPLYVSIPFFIDIAKDSKLGIFVNYTGKLIFDIGIEKYDEIKIKVPNSSVEFFIISGKNIKEIIRDFVKLTGMPFKIPEWALGHSISRYSYFPQEKVIEVLKEYKKYTEVGALYLDIDYMNKNKIFEWNKDYFPNPKKMINEIHKMGTKVVTIVDPAVIADQNDKTFISGIGKYCETKKHELYTADMWAGKSVFPDFLNEEARKWWTATIKKWINTYNIDGIWLDMNEPAAFTQTKTLDDDVLHRKNNKKVVKHGEFHNAYSYFEAMATYAAIKNGFILSRAGYAGIQRYAAIWSGDSVSSWEDMKIQIPLLLSLSVSGIPYVGCDIGGFVGRSDPELLARYYQMSAFFPIFRNHKNRDGNDQEIYDIEEEQRERIKKTIDTRYLFMDYIKELADNAHKYGDPIIRPLLYEFESDENAYNINDEYMVGEHILYAPILEKEKDSREVYLPNDKWLEFNSGVEFQGPCHVKSTSDMPIFIRKGTNIKLADKRTVRY